MYIYIYVYIKICVHTGMCALMCISTPTYIYIYIYVYIYIYIYIYAHAPVHCTLIHYISYTCVVVHAHPAHLCSRYVRHLYLYHGWRISASVSPASPAYIQPTNCRHTHNCNHNTFHTPPACPPPPEEYGGWATGWRRAPTLHPLAMPDTWQSGRVHIAHLPPPKETGGGRDQRCNGG